MNSYPILHVHAAIFPDIIESNVASVALSLIRVGMHNFNFRQLRDEEVLRKRYAQLQESLEKINSGGTDVSREGELGEIVGYAKQHVPLTISRPWSQNRFC